MKKIVIYLLAGSFLLPSVGYGVSRIGGGRINSERSLFTAELSPLYRQVQTGDSARSIYTLPPGLGGLGHGPQGTMLFMEFSDSFPGSSDFSRSEVIDHFRAQNYSVISHHYNLDPCIEVFFKASQDTDQYVLTWGDGKGFQMNITHDVQTQYEGRSLIESVELLEGACSWK